MTRAAILIFVFVFSWVSSCSTSASASVLTCPIPPASSQLLPSGENHMGQCALSLKPIPPLEASGDCFEKALTSKRSDQYTSVLFYASRCQFSMNARSIFQVLSSIYPQIEHFAVEYSSTMPSLYSRYGIHSLPAILLVNQTSRIRYRGSKDLASLVKFYKRVTGLEAVESFSIEQFGNLETSGSFVRQPWVGGSIDEMWRREPYLLFCTLVLLLRVVLYVFPIAVNRVKVMWASCRHHLSLWIVTETSQILGRMVQVSDVKRVWAKLKVFKGRNLRRGARNARVWASSLAS